MIPGPGLRMIQLASDKQKLGRERRRGGGGSMAGGVGGESEAA